VGTPYLRQLLVGRDVGIGNLPGEQMQNFVYLVGDRDARECLVVDPAWDIQGIVDQAAGDDMKIVGALVTHYHPDHVGGTIFGLNIEGLSRLMALAPCPVHVHKLEAEGVRKVTGLDETDLVRHESGDRVKAGDLEVELLHTPGHTPGSQCFRAQGALVSGDTLFLQGCGRVDLPGGDPEQMQRTLAERFSTLPDELVLYPGHAYGGESAPMGEVRRKNPVLRATSMGKLRGRG
jgi:hydroxyacylglutathione hydrolase